MSCDDKKQTWLASQELLSAALAERSQAESDKEKTEATLVAAAKADEAQSAVVEDTQSAVAKAADEANAAYGEWLACVIDPPQFQVNPLRRR